MQIELLWLIPVIAFAAFIFFIAYYVQGRVEERSKPRNLSSEVDRYNMGHRDTQKLVIAKSTDERLLEMERTVNCIADAFLKQNGQLAKSVAERAPHISEINELKEKLRTVFKEYDLVLSENYSLRAKINQLKKQLHQGADDHDAPLASLDSFLTRTTPPSKPALQLYDDTRLISLASLDRDNMSESTDSLAR